MSPFSGVIYGNRCGYNLNKLYNREMFDKIAKPNNINYLIKSINPATRLMAIEYYYCNEAKFSSDQTIEISKEIQKMIEQPLIIRTCYGCFSETDSTINIIREIKNCT